MDIFDMLDRAAGRDKRRPANCAERAAAAHAAASVAREQAQTGAHRARIANAVTAAVLASVDAAVVCPASLERVANAAHRAAKIAAIAGGATPDSIAAAVLSAALSVEP